MCDDRRSSPEFNRERWSRGEGAFTLVEVVIAIAVTSFVIISILGMMAYASHVVQQSDRNARLSTVLGQMQTLLASQPYYQIQGSVSTNPAYYFNSEGLPTNSAGAYYQCNVTNVVPNNFAYKDSWGTPLMEAVQIMIRWPKNGSAPFGNTNIIVTSIANYD